MSASLWQYQREFGHDFAMPPEVLALLASSELEDISWHNDVCPSFTHRWAPYVETHNFVRDLRLWVDFEDEDRRELGPKPRYQVIDHVAQRALVETDNVNEAIAVLRREATKVYLANQEGEI